MEEYKGVLLMPKWEDLTGKEFGRWTVIKDERRKDYKVLCRCECGVEKLVKKNNLKKGDISKLWVLKSRNNYKI